MHILILIAVLICSVSSVHAHALPEDQQTDETVRWLAVAFVAEAGWAPKKKPKAKADHRAVYHALRNRWVARDSGRPYLKMVQNYVAAFDPRTKPEQVERVRWLLSLRPGLDRAPAGWPAKKASWAVHKPLWEAAQARARKCVEGRCKDPYKGKAKHWGGDMDSPSSCMVELENAGTLNTFYGIDRDCMRKKHRRRRNRD